MCTYYAITPLMSVERRPRVGVLIATESDIQPAHISVVRRSSGWRKEHAQHWVSTGDCSLHRSSTSR